LHKQPTGLIGEKEDELCDPGFAEASQSCGAGKGEGSNAAWDQRMGNEDVLPETYSESRSCHYPIIELSH
jgi:hypothetical protein